MSKPIHFTVHIYACAASVFMLMLGSCAAPSEPSGLASSTAAAKSKTTTTAASDGSLVNYGGANVGDTTMKSQVSNCVSTGMFYNRTASPTAICTNLKLAQVNCTDAGIGSAMTAEQKAQLDSLLKTMPGFLLDQCLDCSDPSSSVICSGSGANVKTTPGMRLFYLKEENNVISLQHVYVNK